MNPKILFSTSPFFKKPLFLALILTLILIPLLFYLYRTYYPQTPAQQSTQVPSQPTITESESPIAFDILKNPLVYKWRGTVEGTLTAKDENSITLEKDGRSITIKVDLNPNNTGTRFYLNKASETPKKNEDPRENFVSLEDIPRGNTLRGDFLVYPQQKNEKVGSSFMVIEQ